MKSNKNIILLILTLGAFFSGCNNKKATNYSLALNVKDSAALCIKPIPPGDSAKFISTSVTVSGAVNKEIELNIDSLKKMKKISLDSFLVVCESGAERSHSVHSRGVLLRDIVKKAGINITNHKDRNFAIIARATDNYKATFSWGELFNNPTGDHTIVLYEENGKPIDKFGKMKLICTNDFKTGPRQVVWLKSIEVVRMN